MVHAVLPAGCLVGLAGFTFFVADAVLGDVGRLGFASAAFFSTFLAGGVTAEVGGAVCELAWPWVGSAAGSDGVGADLLRRSERCVSNSSSSEPAGVGSAGVTAFGLSSEKMDGRSPEKAVLGVSRGTGPALGARSGPPAAPACGVISWAGLAAVAGAAGALGGG